MGPGPDDIEAKRFSVALRGYDRHEVGTFLREVAESQRRLLAQRAAAVEKLRRAAESPPPEPTPRPEPEPAPASTADGGLDETAEHLGHELAEIMRAAHRRVADLEAAAVADAEKTRAAAEARAADVRSAADAWADQQRSRADHDRAAAAQALVDAEGEAAGLVQDARRRVADITADAEAAAQRRIESILAAAQHRIDHLSATENRIRQRITAARTELSSALDDLDPTDPELLDSTLRSQVIDLNVRGHGGGRAASPDEGSASVATMAPAAPPETAHTTTRRLLGSDPDADASLDGESAVRPPGEEDEQFDRMVRDALERAVRQSRPPEGR